MRSRYAIAIAGLILLSGGCGSSSHSTSASTLSTAATATVATPTTPSTPAKHAPPKHLGPARASPPKPTGPPPAPAGLRATTGYATYELCSGSCSGSIPASLRRPLRTPAGCVAHSGGAVTPQPATSLTTTPFVGSSWRGGRTQWSAAGYSGAVLIRGRQVGGSSAVGFGVGHVPYDELQLQGGGPWQSFTRVQSPGCYFYQVDGTSFSATIVFRAT